MAEDHLKRSASFERTRRDEPSFEEDPLIELARIVAEDGGFRRQRAPELRPARNEPSHYHTPRHEPASQEDTFASQLEAELMQDLAQPAAELPVQPASDTAAQSAPSQAQSGYSAPRFPQIVIEDARTGHQAQPAGEPAEPFEEELQALFAGAAEAPPAGGAGYDIAEDGGTPIPDAEYDEGHAGAYQESYGASYTAELDALAPAHEHDLQDEHYADPSEEEYASAEPAPAAEPRAPARSRRSYKGLVAAAGVLGVVILGGAVAAIVGSGPDGGPANPPVIRAEAGPAKVTPEQTAEAQAGGGAGQAVYDRVAGRAPKSEEKLVDRAEEPQQVSRVVLPEDGSASQAGEPAGEDAAEEAAEEAQPDQSSPQESIAGEISSDTPGMQSGPRVDPVGPRRVRTVTVRPDGTIVSSREPVQVAEAASQPLGDVVTDFEGADAPEPVSVRTVRIDGGGEEPSRALNDQAAESEAAPAAVRRELTPAIDGSPPEPQTQDEGSAAAAAAEPASRDGGAAAADGGGEAAEPGAPAEEQMAMLPRARPEEVPAAFRNRAAQQPSEPQQAATRPAAARSGDPVNLLDGGPAPGASQAQPAQQAQSSGSSPYAVQLSAQRSEEQARATFASLRSRYPSILGNQQPQIQRADLGERGIYYRVRVGAASQAEANRLCEQLQAAGGSCFVAR